MASTCDLSTQRLMQEHHVSGVHGEIPFDSLFLRFGGQTHAYMGNLRLLIVTPVSCVNTYCMFPRGTTFPLCLSGICSEIPSACRLLWIGPNPVLLS